MSISVQRFDRSVRLVTGLSDLTDPVQFADYVLPAISRLVGCDIATYNEILPERVRYSDFPVSSLSPATNTVFASLVHEHPLVNYYKATADGSPRKISDFLSQPGFHRLNLYQAFFRPLPVEHQMAVTLTGRGPGVIGIALNRAKHDFTETDRDILAVLRGPLAGHFDRLLRRQAARETLTSVRSNDLETLTDGELKVLTLVAAGGTNAAIARRLDCSPRTVAKHLERVYAKLSVSSRAAAAARFAEVSGRH